MQEIFPSSTAMEAYCTLTTRWQLDYFKRERRRQILISYREEGLFFTAFKHGLILINFMQPKYRTWGRSKHSRIRAQNGDLLQVQVFSTTPPLRYTYILGIPKQISPLSFSNTQNSSVHCSGGRGSHSAQPLRSNPHSGPSITNGTLTHRQYYPHSNGID